MPKQKESTAKNHIAIRIQCAVCGMILRVSAYHVHIPDGHASPVFEVYPHKCSPACAGKE